MNGPKAFFHAAFQIVSRVAFVAVGLPALYLTEPFVRIRLGILNDSQIGMLAIVTDIFCRRLKVGAFPPGAKFVFFAWNPANRQLLDMWKRVLPIVESKVMRAFAEAIQPILERTRFHAECPYHHIEHEEMAKAPTMLSFTPAEDVRGRRALAEMGIGPDDWFVCFHARDPAYKAQRTGFGKTDTRANIRDCSIENFIPAARLIAARGGFAIRMGKIVESPLPDLGPRVVDYASHHRSDFMDIYLSGRCRFFLASDSGAYVPALCMDIPVACTNMAGFMDVGLGPRMMYIPKLLRRKTDGRLLTIPEIKGLGLFEVPVAEGKNLYNPLRYEHMCVEWVENSADEIADLCLDMIDHLEGRRPPPEAERLQALYRGYYDGPHSSPYAGPIGPRFVLRHAALIEPENRRQVSCA